METKAVLLSTLNAKGRWVSTISRTFTLKKVQNKYVYGATFVNATKMCANGGTFS